MAVTAAVLCGAGAYLILGRQLSRLVIGIALLGHGVNVLLVLSGGPGGEPAFVGSGSADSFSDPLPQALVLTAIVISFAMTALFLVVLLALRGLTGTDHVDGREDAG
jgi:multicomponent K+:H+ antiporter subunit C